MDKATKLQVAIGLACVFIVVEVVGGFIANSLAIFSDAAHLLSDVAGFAIALIAVIAAKTPGTKNFTYGLARAEIVGALSSILLLWVVTVALLFEAFDRAVRWMEGLNDGKINGKMMFFIAIFGIVVNLVLMFVFRDEHGSFIGGHHNHEDEHSHSHKHHHSHHEESDHDVDVEARTETSSLLTHAVPVAVRYDAVSHEHHHTYDHEHGSNNDQHAHHHESQRSSYKESSSLSSHKGPSSDHIESRDANIEAAYMHVITDLVQSIGVALAGLVIWINPELQIIDPICTVLFSLLVMRYTFPLVSKILLIFMEGKPDHVDWDELEQKIAAIPDVIDVHDLHIWHIGSSQVALTVHIKAYNPQLVLTQAHNLCSANGITHATIQVQDARDPRSCPSEVRIVTFPHTGWGLIAPSVILCIICGYLFFL